MKKFFAIIALAATVAACNNEADTTTATDSTSVTVDSTVLSTDTASMAPMGGDTSMSTSTDTTTTSTTTTTTTDSVQK